MTFQPYPTRSGFISLGIVTLAVFLALFLGDSLLYQSDPLEIFISMAWLLLALLILGSALYWTMIAFKLCYHLTRNGLTIQWGPLQYVIPFDKIKTIIYGHNLPTPPTFRGINMAGLRFGRGELAEYGPLKFHATAALAESLVVVTPHQSYVISPRQPDNFIRAWQARQTLGPTQQWSMEIRRSWFWNMPLLTDRLALWLFGLAFLICLSLFGYLALIFVDLPATLPIHFDALGQADRIAEKSNLFLFPAAGALVIGINIVLGNLIYLYFREKVAAYLLWAATIVMQLSLWIALLNITA